MTREEKIIALKEQLRARAKKRWPDDQAHQDRYVWGTINKLKAAIK